MGNKLCRGCRPSEDSYKASNLSVTLTEHDGRTVAASIAESELPPQESVPGTHRAPPCQHTQPCILEECRGPLSSPVPSPHHHYHHHHHQPNLQPAAESSADAAEVHLEARRVAVPRLANMPSSPDSVPTSALLSAAHRQVSATEWHDTVPHFEEASPSLSVRSEQGSFGSASSAEPGVPASPSGSLSIQPVLEDGAHPPAANGTASSPGPQAGPVAGILKVRHANQHAATLTNGGTENGAHRVVRHLRNSSDWSPTAKTRAQSSSPMRRQSSLPSQGSAQEASKQITPSKRTSTTFADLARQSWPTPFGRANDSATKRTQRRSTGYADQANHTLTEDNSRPSGGGGGSSHSFLPSISLSAQLFGDKKQATDHHLAHAQVHGHSKSLFERVYEALPAVNCLLPTEVNDEGLPKSAAECTTLGVDPTRGSYVSNLDPRAPHNARLPAGQTIHRAPGKVWPECGDAGLREDHEAIQDAYEEPSPLDFPVRTETYLANKAKKAYAAPPLYGLVTMDLFSTDLKMDDVMTRLKLPELPAGKQPADIPGLKPWLILNVQLPSTQPSLFGGPYDGTGYSCVFCYALRESARDDPVSLDLMRRFTADEKEHNGQPFRDRMKMLPRVANKEQAMSDVLKSTTERKLLQNYNGKPVMMKPQNRYYIGSNYLEIDVDVHGYAFLGRKMLSSFYPRFNRMVLDGAFVLQGNHKEELPERIVCCLRMYRLNFDKYKPLPPLNHTTTSQATDEGAIPAQLT